MSATGSPRVGVSPPPDQPQRFQAARRVTVVGAVVNVVLSILKVVFGVVGQSQALVADGIHSFSDLVSDVVVLVASKHGSRDADADHPYGHGRIETVATVLVGLILFGAAAGIMYDAAKRLMTPGDLLHPGLLALMVAIVSVIAKEALTQYTLRVARHIRSALLRANAWHHRSDAISSVAVIIGVAGSMAGATSLDAIAAIFVALMIAKIAWDLCRGGIQELIDTGLDPEQISRVRHVILSVAGVKALHTLRSRRMGADALVDVHILVEPRLSVSEGHQISETVRARLVHELEDVADVTVHIDPEDDEVTAPSAGLPLRPELMNALHDQWRGVGAAKDIEQVTLHYLDGKVHLEILLPVDLAQTTAERQRIVRSLREHAQALQYVGDVNVSFH